MDSKDERPDTHGSDVNKHKCSRLEMAEICLHA